MVARDLGEEPVAGLTSRPVHVVIGKIGDRSHETDLRAEHALHRLARRVADQHGAEPRAAIGGDGRHLRMLCRRPARCRPRKLEGDAGQEDAVEEALEDRRVAEVPDRVDDDQRLGGEQPLDIGLDVAAVGADLVVVDPLLAATAPASKSSA